MQGENDKSEYAKPEKSGVTPRCVEDGARDGCAHAAMQALEFDVARLIDWKAVWGRRLDKAFHSIAKALWAQPMRWIAVCGRFLEGVNGKSWAHAHKPVAIRVCLELARLRQLLLRIEKFLLKRVLLHGDRVIAADYVHVRGLLLQKVLLDFYEGRINANALMDVKDALDEIAKNLERLNGSRGECCEVGWCHGESIAF